MVLQTFSDTPCKHYSDLNQTTPRFDQSHRSLTLVTSQFSISASTHTHTHSHTHTYTSVSWCFQLRGRRVDRYVFAFSPNDTRSDMYVYIHIAIVWRVCTHSYCATTKTSFALNLIFLSSSLYCANTHVWEPLLQQMTKGQLLLQPSYPLSISTQHTELQCVSGQSKRKVFFQLLCSKRLWPRVRD